jgi:hypothetical protein
MSKTALSFVNANAGLAFTVGLPLKSLSPRSPLPKAPAGTSAPVPTSLFTLLFHD